MRRGYVALEKSLSGFLHTGLSWLKLGFERPGNPLSRQELIGPSERVEAWQCEACQLVAFSPKPWVKP
jgi:hypothetical protein